MPQSGLTSLLSRFLEGLKRSRLFWITLRIYTVAAVVSEIAFPNYVPATIGWVGCAASPLVLGTFVLVWLTVGGRAPMNDWPRLFSLTRPFFPVSNYRAHYCLLAAVGLSVGGAIAIVRSVTSGFGDPTYGAMFLLIGIAILIAIAVAYWIGKGTAGVGQEP